MTEIWINRKNGKMLIGQMLKIGDVAGEFILYKNGKEFKRKHIKFRKNYERIF